MSSTLLNTFRVRVGLLKTPRSYGTSTDFESGVACSISRSTWKRSYCSKYKCRGFHGTGFVRFDPSKLLSCIKSVINECVEVRSVTSIDSATSSIESIFTIPPLNTNEVHAANTVLRSQHAAGGVLSTPLRDYATFVIREIGEATGSNNYHRGATEEFTGSND